MLAPPADETKVNTLLPFVCRTCPAVPSVIPNSVKLVGINAETIPILVSRLAEVAALAFVSAKADTEFIRLFTDVIAALLLLILVAIVALSVARLVLVLEILVANVELKLVTLLFTDVIVELLFAILVAIVADNEAIAELLLEIDVAIVELTAAILVSSVADVLTLAYVAASRSAIAEELAATDV